MKLIRFGDPGNEKPGIYLNEKRYDLSGNIEDYDEDIFCHRWFGSIEKHSSTGPADLPKWEQVYDGHRL